MDPIESWDSMKTGIPLKDLLGRPKVLMFAAPAKTASPSHV
jgi:hypothetical protein